MGWYVGVLKNYAVFNGRAPRQEYWMFVLINLIIGSVLGVIDATAGLAGPGYGVLSGIYSLVVLIPSIAVAVRRLHDADRSGLWFLLVFVPVIGSIALIVFLVQDGHSGANQYGEDPRAAA